MLLVLVCEILAALALEPPLPTFESSDRAVVPLVDNVFAISRVAVGRRVEGVLIPTLVVIVGVADLNIILESCAAPDL